jgi:hypothetical protein
LQDTGNASRQEPATRNDCEVHVKLRHRFGLALVVIALAIPVFGEETVTIRLSTTPWVPMGCQGTTGNPDCGFWSADDPTKIVYVFLSPNTECTAFVDPVPKGGKAVSIDLKFPHGPASIPFLSAIYVNLTQEAAPSYLVGTVTVDAISPSQFECNESRPAASVAMLEGPHKAGGIPDYNYGGLNFIGSDPNWAGFGWEYVDVTVHYEPPRVVQFDVTNETPELQRRMVIHNSRSNYPYPSVNQVATSDIERPQYTISGHVTSGSHGVEADLWLRVLDPADPSPYLPSDMQHENDNMDTKPRGTLLAISCAAPCLPSDTIQVHTTADGAFSVRLEGTDRYAGDNYMIEAGDDAEFSCTSGGPARSNICARSGTITAWKRIFVEKQKMLRNGISLTADAHPSDTSIRVADNHYGGNQGRHGRIGKGDRIVLVHGSALDRRNLSVGSYYEEHTVESVSAVHGTKDYVVSLGTKIGNLVTAEHLAHEFGRDPSSLDVPFLADSISALVGTNLSTADWFDASDDLFSNVFAEAFTEYVILPDRPSGFVPVANFGNTNEPDLQAFANKWSASVGTDGDTPPNHQLLLIADSDHGTAPDAGMTVTQVRGQASSWVWRGTIETQVTISGNPNAGQDPNLWAAKNTAHELAHQWKTDTMFNLVDHCPATTKAYNDSSLYCLLANNSTGGAETQRGNGIARFHLLPLPGGGWHSEYFEIRRRLDPFLP